MAAVSRCRDKSQEICRMPSMLEVNNNKSSFIFMKHTKKKSQDKPAWQIAWELAKYPAKIHLSKKMSRADVVFCLMMWLGMSKVDAFLTAYPQTKASRNSIAAMATRRSQEEWVSEYFQALYDLYLEDKLKFNPIP